MIYLVGGKGGVGKTTISFSIAMGLADRKRKVLLLTTDPAPNLEDIQYSLSNNSLDFELLQIDAEEELKKFKETHWEELTQLLDTSSYLDEEDITELMKLQLPGLDELMGFRLLIEKKEDGKYDDIVVDTAPTGHTLRMLQMPELLNSWIKTMAKMRWKYRFLKKALMGRYDPDQGDDLLLSLKRTVSRTKSILSNREESEFVLVCKPEEIVIKETLRYLHRLAEISCHVNRIIVNGVLDEKSDEGSFYQSMKEHQQFQLTQVQAEISDNITLAYNTLAPRPYSTKDEYLAAFKRISLL